MLVSSVLLLLVVANNAEQLPTTVTGHVNPLKIKAPEGSEGSMIAADLDRHWPPELLVTAPGYLGPYRVNGERLWSQWVDIRVGKQPERQGLPGHHAPAVQEADIDGDGATEVLFLTQDNALHAWDGSSGEERWSVTIPHPEGAERWGHLAVANFRRQGDRDLLLQATNARGYRMGRWVAGFAPEHPRAGCRKALGQWHEFLACAHNDARLADLDGDGRDEVLAGTTRRPGAAAGTGASVGAAALPARPAGVQLLQPVTCAAPSREWRPDNTGRQAAGDIPCARCGRKDARALAGGHPGACR